MASRHALPVDREGLKRLADAYGIQPGDDIEFPSAGDAIRVVPSGEGRLSARWDVAAYGLSWCDAHMWSYAEMYLESMLAEAASTIGRTARCG